MKKRKFDEGGFTDAEDKATGLATSGKEAPVGFFKRLMMGNIDDATSEAGQKFGAGRARLDRMPVAPERNKTINMEGLQAPAVNKPFVNLKNQPDEGDSNVGIASIPTGPSGYKRDTEGEAASELARESRRTTPTKAPVRRTNPSISASDKPKPPGPMGNTNPRDAEKGVSRGQRESISASDKPQPPAGSMRGYGEIANLDSIAVRDRKTAQMMMAQDEKLRKKRAAERLGMDTYGMKKGGSIKAYASGGSVSSRADGCAQRGKTRGMMR